MILACSFARFTCVVDVQIYMFVTQRDMPWSTQPLRRHLSDLTPSESIATSDDEEVKVGHIICHYDYINILFMNKNVF